MKRIIKIVNLNKERGVFIPEFKITKQNFLLLFLVFNYGILTSIGQTNNIEKQKEVVKRDSISANFLKGYRLTGEFKYQEGLSLINSSISEAIKMDDDNLIAKGYLYLGIIYVYLDKFDLALRASKKAIKYAKKSNNKAFIISANNNIAFAYYENLNNLDSGAYYFKKTLTLSKKYKKLAGISTSYYNLGDMYQELNQLDSALVCFNKSIHYLSKKEGNYTSSFVYLGLSKVYFKLKDTTKGMEYLNYSLKKSKKHKFNDVLLELYNLKCQVLKKKRKNKEALFYLEKYKEIEDLSHEGNLSKITQELITQYQLKETENLLEEIITVNKEKEKNLKMFRVLLILTFILIIILISLVSILFQNNQLKKEHYKLLVFNNVELKKLQLKTELNFLKNQVQPHFIFDTLDRLFTLISEKSEQSKDIILKLSQFMQYIVYDTKKRKVSIWDEIDTIQNYLELKFFKNEISSAPSLEIKGNIDAIKVPPLLFTALVEDFFKYRNTYYDKRFELYISIKKTGVEYMSFLMKKTFAKNDDNKTTKEENLKNIKRRLELLYKDKYELCISKKNKVSKIELKIPVNF